MAMEVEVDPRHRVLPFKVRAASKEAQPHKAAHVLDPDPKSHWSTSTNAKEWLLLELEEPCLLQQIRIHNKSVIEWEISLGLRYKPDLFSKVRSRCEAPRRESQYMANYASCRYIRLSCLRGNPIAIYSVQLIGIPMPGLEPEFQPLVDHLLPHITSNKPEVQDLYLQLLWDIMTRLAPFITYLEGDLATYNENMELTLRYLAMLSGPFYPILMAIDERERVKNLATANDIDSSKGAQISLFTVSSNFQAPPRRSRSPAPSQQSGGQLIAFRPDVALLFLKVAYKDNVFGTVCKMIARVFSRISTGVPSLGANGVSSDVLPGSLGQIGLGTESISTSGEYPASCVHQTDYSSIFGEEFRVPEDGGGDLGLSELLDIAAVEEGLLHFLYASIAKPILCRRLAEVKPDLVPVLPFIQAILPAIRPASIGIVDQPDESFTPWQAPVVQRAFSQVVSLATTSSYRPLLDACAGYLCSFSLAHEKAACIIIDLCSGPLAPWLPVVVAKMDLAFELVEGVLGYIQMVDKGAAYARAALVYVILGLSGHIDESLSMYKAVKHNLIFVIEMLEPFLLPAITPIKNTIAFGDVSAVLTEKQEHACSLALDILRAAMKKPAILPSLEKEWRKGIVKPSVLLSVVAPQLPLPAGVDAQKGVTEKADENLPVLPTQNVADAKAVCDNIAKNLVTEDEVASKSDLFSHDNFEDPSVFFIPTELKFVKMLSSPPQDTQDFGQFARKGESKPAGRDTKDTGVPEFLISENLNPQELLNLHTDHFQLVNFQERELRAAEFISFAAELHTQDGACDNGQAAIDCLLLAAECHLNPLMLHSVEYEHLLNRPGSTDSLTKEKLSLSKGSPEDIGLSRLFSLEEERDKAVLQILLKAAEWDAKYMGKAYEGLQNSEDFNPGGGDSKSVDARMSIENSLIDATTLVRKRQTLLSRFLIVQLQREGEIIYEALLQGLLFFLSAATELSCSPEHVVDIILRTANRLNVCLLSKFKHSKSKHSNKLAALSIYRHWSLLCRLVAAASGGETLEDDDEFKLSDLVWQKELVPPSAWMSKITEFASSPFPLVRFIGWKGLARFAKLQQQTGVVLASDLQQLSSLLAVFADDLMSSGITEYVYQHEDVEPLRGSSSNDLDQCSSGNNVRCLYPEVDLVCPRLTKQFSACANAILDAVCLQVKGFPVTALPDILSWFSELCCHPYILESKPDSRFHTKIKGYAAANVRFIILRLLEVILLEHMEAMVPELPRVFSVILSLCQSSYCDISLLDSVLKALKPILSYGIASAASTELQIEDDCGTLTFEALCFEPLMELLRKGPDPRSGSVEQIGDRSFLLFLSGVVLSDMSMVRKLELMHLLRNWADFTAFSETTSYYNYVCAFQKVFEACQWLLEKTMNYKGLSLVNVAGPSKECMEEKNKVVTECSPTIDTDGDATSSAKPQEGEELHVEEILLESTHPQIRNLTTDESCGSLPEVVDPLLLLGLSDLQEFAKCLGNLVFALVASLEKVWKLHLHLAEKLTKTIAYCIMASSYLAKHSFGSSSSAQNDMQNLVQESQSVMEGRQQAPLFYGAALDTVTQAILTFQQSHCWQIAACTMEFLLSQPASMDFFEVLPSFCSVLQYQCAQAPRVSWRQVSLKWLSRVVTRLIAHGSSIPIAPLMQLFKVFMEHKEPEQRAGALQELENLVDLEELGRHSFGAVSSSNVVSKQQTPSTRREKLGNADVLEIVDAKWDSVCSLAACDPCAGIRRRAIKLLTKFVPLAQSHHLQKLLSSVDTFLPGLSKDTYTMIDAPVTRLSLALLSRACLYSTSKEVSMVPSRVWSSLEVLVKQRHGSILAEAERATCNALLQLRENGDDAKQLIQDALSRQTERQPQVNVHFTAVQESVLQVLARINVIREIEDITSAENAQEAKDLEEAEIELELIRQERSPKEKIDHEVFQKKTAPKAHIPSPGVNQKSRKERLEQLRAQILLEEHSTTREEIIARRERQRLARHKRQLALEGCMLREIELLQDLDREKAAEVERDIERQRLLERERAKTKELRHSLELEAEKRTQRDLQRELEQRESGTVRPSRREFSGSGSASRPRERYREREGGRSSQDARSSTGVARENSTTPPATPTAGSRSIGR